MVFNDFIELQYAPDGNFWREIDEFRSETTWKKVWKRLQVLLFFFKKSYLNKTLSNYKIRLVKWKCEHVNTKLVKDDGDYIEINLNDIRFVRIYDHEDLILFGKEHSKMFGLNKKVLLLKTKIEDLPKDFFLDLNNDVIVHFKN